MAEMWLRYSWDVAEIWLRCYWDMTEMFLRCAWDVPEIWLRYSWDVGQKGKKCSAPNWGPNWTDLVRIRTFLSKVVRKRSELTTKSPNLWIETTCKSSLHLKTCYIEGKLIVYDPSSDFVIRPTCSAFDFRLMVKSYIFDLGETKNKK